MHLSENWAQVVWNPDALGNNEKKLWAELEPKIRALLEELKENGHIETVLVKHEAESLRPMGDKFNEFVKLQNAMNHVFERDVSRRFLAAKCALSDDMVHDMLEQQYCSLLPAYLLPLLCD